MYLVLFSLTRRPLLLASFSILEKVSFNAFLLLLIIATSSAYASICVLFVPIGKIIYTLIMKGTKIIKLMGIWIVRVNIFYGQVFRVSQRAGNILTSL